MLAVPSNVTGGPVFLMGRGSTETGLPLAFQLAGKPFDEATVLKLAHAYEKATPWRSIRPQLDS